MSVKKLKKGKKIEFASIEDVILFINGEISFDETQRRVKENPPAPAPSSCCVTEINIETKTVTFSVPDQF